MATTELITYYGKPDVVYDSEVDVIDNGTLTSTQVDKNFNTLEGRSIKSTEMSEDGTKLIVTLLNGKTFEAEISTTYATKEYVKESIEASYVFTDDSLEGNGTIKNPLKVSRMTKTGVLRPISKVVEELPTEDLKIGDRYVIGATLDKNGALYNYEGVKNIISTLNTEFESSEYPWRVARKVDWDDMLDALEPESQDRHHHSKKEAEYLGEFAGAYLQKEEYGFNVSNCGYAYEEGQDEPHLVFNGEREGWWTASNDNYKRAFIKRVNKYTESGDNGGVWQDIESSDHFYSVRLVRDTKPVENNANETIMGVDYPVVKMPSIENGLRMWISINFSSNLVGDDEEATTDLNKECRYVPSEWSSDNVFYVCEWDGTNWVKTTVNTYDTFFNIEKKEFYYLTEEGKLEPVNKSSEEEMQTLDSQVKSIEESLNEQAQDVVDDAINHVYDDYTMVGTFTRNGNTVTYTTNSTDAKDTLYDFARYFGAHYYENQVKSIRYNGNRYKWYDLGLKGSNYSLDGTLNTTLMKQLTEDFTKESLTSIKYRFNGVTITITK